MSRNIAVILSSVIYSEIWRDLTFYNSGYNTYEKRPLQLLHRLGHAIEREVHRPRHAA
jgi:hypothetical protein